MSKAICVNHVSKTFKVYKDKSHNLKEKVLFWNRNLSKKKLILMILVFKLIKVKP